MPSRVPRYVNRKLHESPILLALSVALLVVTIPLLMILSTQSDLKRQQDAIQATQRDSQANRIAVSRAVCAGLNSNAKANNGQSLFLAGLIVGSVEQSKPFQQAYDNFGLPSYKARLSQARRIAGVLKSLSVRSINCVQFMRYVQELIPPREMSGGQGKQPKNLLIPTGPPEYPKIPELMPPPSKKKHAVKP